MHPRPYQLQGGGRTGVNVGQRDHPIDGAYRDPCVQPHGTALWVRSAAHLHYPELLWATELTLSSAHLHCHPHCQPIEASAKAGGISPNQPMFRLGGVQSPFLICRHVCAGCRGVLASMEAEAMNELVTEYLHRPSTRRLIILARNLTVRYSGASTAGEAAGGDTSAPSARPSMSYLPARDPMRSATTSALHAYSCIGRVGRKRT
jgi:hypothetical protein